MRFFHFSPGLLFPGLLLLSLTATLAAPASASPRDDGTRASDVCVGGGTAGPYPLSWTHVLPGTETVQIDGLAQTRGLDYALDADTGTITFTRPLPARSVAAVTYAHDALLAKRQGTDRAVPLSLDLVRGDRGYFSLNALGKTQGAGGGDVTLGVGLGVTGGGDNRLSTRLIYSPLVGEAGGDAGPDGGGFSRRLGLAAAASADAGHWGLFSFGLSQIGSGVRDAGDGLTAGQERLDLKALLTPLKQVRAEVSYGQSRPTDDPHAQTSTDAKLALSVAPSDTTRIDASLGQAGAGAGQTQTVGLSADARPAPAVQVHADFAAKDAPGSSDDTQAVTLKTTLTPSRMLSLETGAGQSRTAQGLTDRQSVSVTLTPRAGLRLDAGLALRQSAPLGRPGDALAASVATVGGSARPLSFLEVSGTYQSRSASAADTDARDLLDSSAARIAFSPVSAFRVVGTYAVNPADGGDGLQRVARRGLGVETHWGALGLSGGCDWSRASDAPDASQTVHADLGLRFSAATQLSVGFQSRQDLLLPAAPPATAYTLGLSHAVGDRVRLSLSGKRTQDAAAPPDYNASASLGLKF